MRRLDRIPWPSAVRALASRLGLAAAPTVDWSRLAAGATWERAKREAGRGPNVLIATSMGGFQHGALLESTLAAALTLRGARVDVLLCDSALPACQLTEITHTAPRRVLTSPPQPRCRTCQAAGLQTFEPLGLSLRRYSDLLSDEDRREARSAGGSASLATMGSLRLDGLALGEHALAGTLRYFASGRLDEEPMAEAVARRYLEAAFLTARAVQRLLAEREYAAAVFNHGIYVPQGVIGEVCRAQGVRAVTWNPAYRRHCFIFSHGDSYHHTMLSEPTGEWEAVRWSPPLEQATLEYLESRWRGSGDWIWFHDRPQEDAAAIAGETGLDFSRPVVTLLTNVMWDAQLHYASNAFTDMLEWLLQTVAYFARRPELQLAIRVHPAEIRGLIPSRQPIVAELRRRVPQLPGNIVVISPESQTSTYALAARSNAVIIYGTKTGIEVASMGIPVIVAGEAWIRGKGFSLDAATAGEYFRILDRLPLAERMSEAEMERARRYAFHFFFRRMIPLPFIVDEGRAHFLLRLGRLGELADGTHPGLDVICRGILTGSAFVYPAEGVIGQPAAARG